MAGSRASLEMMNLQTEEAAATTTPQELLHPDDLQGSTERRVAEQEIEDVESSNPPVQEIEAVESSNPHLEENASSQAIGTTGYEVTCTYKSCVWLMLFLGYILGYVNAHSALVTLDTGFLFDFFKDILMEKRKADADNFCLYFNPELQLLINSIYLAATAMGPVFLFLAFVRKLGMRRFLIIGTSMLLVGVAISTGALNGKMLIVGRLIMALGGGLYIQVIPLYISLLPNPKRQAALFILFSVGTKLGMILANLLGLWLLNGYENRWRWLSGIPMIFIVPVFLSLFWICDAPLELIIHGKVREARESLIKFGFKGDVESEAEKLRLALNDGTSLRKQFQRLIKPTMCPIVWIIIFSQLFQALTGGITIMFFGPILLKSIGFDSDAAILSSIIGTCVSVLPTIFSGYIVAKFSRKHLILGSCIIMFITQLIQGILLRDLPLHGRLTRERAGAITGLACLFLFAFSISTGPLGWLSVSFPPESVVVGTLMSTTLLSLLSFLLFQFTVPMFCGLHFWVFIGFSASILVFFIFIIFMVPELAGVPEDEIVERVWGQHWLWKRCGNYRGVYMSRSG